LLPSVGTKVPWIEREGDDVFEEHRSLWLDPWFPGCGRQPTRKRGVAERYSLYPNDVKSSLSYRLMQLLSQCKSVQEEKGIIERYWKRCFPNVRESWPLLMKWRKLYTTKRLIMAMIVTSKRGITKPSEVPGYIVSVLRDWETNGVEIYG